MKSIAFILAFTTAVVAASIGGHSNTKHRDLESFHSGHFGLPYGSGVWDDCEYNVEVMKSTNGKHIHTDYHCHLPVDYYNYNHIVSFHITTESSGWDHENHVSCWYGTGVHGEMMLHCDSQIYGNDRALIHLLCCSCNHYRYFSLDMETTTSSSNNNETNVNFPATDVP